MALKQQKQTTRPAPGMQTQGPSMAEGGHGATALPPNPSDQIFQGRALPIIPPQQTTSRRDFTIPIRPTLHYRDGVDGAAETVTVNERRLNGPDGNPIDYVDDADDLKYGPRQGIDQDWDHGEFGTEPGPSYEGGPGGPNDAYTTNGQWIRGT